VKSVELASSLGADALARVEAFAAQHGAVTLALLRRAVRDSAILADLKARPGQYEAIGARWGVTGRTVRDIEDFAKALARTM